MKNKATREEFETAMNTAYRNGLGRCYDLAQMAAYMFLEGIKFERFGKCTEDELFTEKENERL